MIKAMEIGNSSQGISNLSNIKYRLEDSLVDIESKLSPLKYYAQLEKIIEWYNKKGHHEKSRFDLYQIVIIMAGISIPAINMAYGIEILSKLEIIIVVSIATIVIFFSTAINQVHQYEEKWISTSTIREALNNEKDFFDNNAGNYNGLNDDQKQRLLVERAKFIIQDEFSGFLPNL